MTTNQQNNGGKITLLQQNNKPEAEPGQDGSPTLGKASTKPHRAKESGAVSLPTRSNRTFSAAGSWKKVKKYAPMIIKILILIVVLDHFGLKSLWAILAFMIAWALYRAWKMRENIRMFMWQVETLVWGKPLERDFWKPEELKHNKRRIKFVWRSGTMDKMSKLNKRFKMERGLCVLFTLMFMISFVSASLSMFTLYWIAAFIMLIFACAFAVFSSIEQTRMDIEQLMIAVEDLKDAKTKKNKAQ